jgi:FkbM family methyltransferase
MPPSAVASRLIENQHIAVKQCRHGLFAYNLNDLYIGRSLDAYGEWCEAELSVLFQVLKPGGVAVDIGANIGTHTVALAKHVTSNGVVVAVEPQRLTYQLLNANVALNALVNVQCLNVVAGDASGRMRIPTLNPAFEGNFGALKAEGHTEGELVDMIRIDDIGLARCNLMKIDVEGMEARVLAGARKTIKSHRPVLFVENNSETGSPATLKALDDLGYTCWWHVASYYNPANYFGNPERLWGEYREANVLCFPKEATVNAVGLWPVENADDTYVKALQRHTRA